MTTKQLPKRWTIGINGLIKKILNISSKMLWAKPLKMHSTEPSWELISNPPKFIDHGRKIWTSFPNTCLFQKIATLTHSTSAWSIQVNISNSNTKIKKSWVFMTWLLETVHRLINVSQHALQNFRVAMCKWIKEILKYKIQRWSSLPESFHSNLNMIWAELLKLMQKLLMRQVTTMQESVRKLWRKFINVMLDAPIELPKTGLHSIQLMIQCNADVLCQLHLICQQVILLKNQISLYITWWKLTLIDRWELNRAWSSWVKTTIQLYWLTNQKLLQQHQLSQ